MRTRPLLACSPGSQMATRTFKPQSPDPRDWEHLHVGQNVPGYLPESEPACYDNLDSALEGLEYELRSYQEAIYEHCETPDIEGCECGWCEVGSEVEAHISGIADGDAQHWLQESRYGTLSFVFDPPSGAATSVWIQIAEGDRDSCELIEDEW